jgi:hypothetical protein
VTAVLGRPSLSQEEPPVLEKKHTKTQLIFINKIERDRGREKEIGSEENTDR